LRAFCESQGIEFVSVTRMLREHVARGDQVLYTYDAHWTPAGQKAVGEVLAAYLRAKPLHTAP
jgi:hypothetical protein